MARRKRFVYTKEYLLSKNGDEEEEYYIKEGLPELVREGDLESVKNILEHYKLDFTEIYDYDYVGNGESYGPGNVSKQTLLDVACESRRDHILAYFINELMKRGKDPYKYVSDPYCVDQYMAWLNKKKLLLMRRRLPNNIVLGKLSKYLEPENTTIFTPNAIRRLVTESKKRNNNSKNNNKNKNQTQSKSKSNNSKKNNNMTKKNRTTNN